MANLTPLILNNVASTVQAGSSAIGSASATGVNVASGDGANFGTIGTNQFIPAVIVDTSTSPETVKEYVWITARSTDALTVVRQAEESSRYAASTSTIQSGYIIAAVTTRNSQYGALPLPSPLVDGIIAWTYDYIQASTSIPLGNTTGSGGLLLTRIAMPRTASVTNILLSIQSAGTTLSNSFAGIYSSSGTKLAGSADQSTSWQSAGFKTIAMTGAPITITPAGPDDFVWGAVLVGGTGGTLPSFASTSILLNIETAFGGTKARTGYVNGTLTALPSSFTPSTITSQFNANAAVWMALT